MKNFTQATFVLIALLLSAGFTTFAQIDWKKDTANNPVIDKGVYGSWDRQIIMPCVLYNPDSSRYEMWYAGFKTTHPYSIGFASSSDGLHWTKHPVAVLESGTETWDASTVNAPSVLRENGQYKMWYFGSKDDPYVGGIGYATSTDGLNWTKDLSNSPVIKAGTDAWEEGVVAFCSVMPATGGGYKMWYGGMDAGFTRSQIGYATSSDGISWTKIGTSNPVLQHGSNASWDDGHVNVFGKSVLFKDNKYYMLYTGSKPTGSIESIGLAVSNDGINWIRYNDPSSSGHLYLESDPVLEPEAQYNELSVGFASVLTEGDSLRMWYSSYDGSFYSISHAVSHFDPGVTGLPEIIQSRVRNVSVITHNYPFRTTTTIKYTLHDQEQITIKIFNSLGQEMETLINSYHPAGNYELKWTPEELNPGIYFYRIQSGKHSVTRKLILHN